MELEKLIPSYDVMKRALELQNKKPVPRFAKITAKDFVWKTEKVMPVLRFIKKDDANAWLPGKVVDCSGPTCPICQFMAEAERRTCQKHS